jgi:hypothetical protein
MFDGAKIHNIFSCVNFSREFFHTNIIKTYKINFI